MSSDIADGLARLGMTYNEYLQSPHWSELRGRYYQQFHKQCRICGADNDVHLHHLTYKRLGEERLRDLVPLCGQHHEALHHLHPGLHHLRGKTKTFFANSAPQAPGIRFTVAGKFQTRTTVKVRISKRKRKRVFVGHFDTFDAAKAAQAEMHRRAELSKRYCPSGKEMLAKRVKLGLCKACPRCQEPMMKYQHAEGWKPEEGKGYYAYWFKCVNKRCKTTAVCPPDAFVKAGARITR